MKQGMETGLFALKLSHIAGVAVNYLAFSFPSFPSPSVPLLYELAVQPNFIRKSSTIHRAWADWKAEKLSLPFNLDWIRRGSSCCWGTLGSEGDLG